MQKMLPKTHIFFGLIFSIFIFILFPEIEITGFLLIWLSSFLIDVDHYLFYIFTKNDFSLKNAHCWFIKKSEKAKKLSKSEKKKLITIPCIFHGLELIFILIILSFFHKYFFFILIGILFHELLDVILIINEGFKLDHIFCQTKNIINYHRNLCCFL
jgi:hypothetical protein